MDRVPSGATIPGQSGHGSNGNGGALRIPGTAPDCLVSYLGQSLGCLTPLQRFSQCILLPQPTGQKDNKILFESKHNTTGVRTVLLRGRCPAF